MREAGLEPARPEWTLEPESSESANSTTRALFAAVSRLLQYSTTGSAKSQALFSAFFSHDVLLNVPHHARAGGTGFGKESMPDAPPPPALQLTAVVVSNECM